MFHIILFFCVSSRYGCIVFKFRSLKRSTLSVVSVSVFKENRLIRYKNSRVRQQQVDVTTTYRSHSNYNCSTLSQEANNNNTLGLSSYFYGMYGAQAERTFWINRPDFLFNFMLHDAWRNVWTLKLIKSHQLYSHHLSDLITPDTIKTSSLTE